MVIFFSKLVPIASPLTVTVNFVFFRRQKSAESAEESDENVDELSLIDHKEIMSRLTLKQEVRQQKPIYLFSFDGSAT